MLPCSSSAQMEGCEEERDAHMQTEVNRKKKQKPLISLILIQFIVNVNLR